jgi:hypothetical protein
MAVFPISVGAADLVAWRGGGHFRSASTSGIEARGAVCSGSALSIAFLYAYPAPAMLQAE